MYYVLMDIAEGYTSFLIGIYTDEQAAKTRREEYALNEVNNIFSEDPQETGLEDTPYERTRIYKEIVEGVVILPANELGGI